MPKVTLTKAEIAEESGENGKQDSMADEMKETVHKKTIKLAGRKAFQDLLRKKR